jgi:hypothetical protein
MAAMGRLFLLLFVLANSGFTLVLYQCAMSAASEDMACCETSGKEMDDSCQMSTGHQPAQSATVTSNDACHSVVVAGGLQETPSFVEKVALSSIDKTILTVAVAPLLSVPSLVTHSFSLHTSVETNVSPRAVDTYVLNSTFLI